MFEDLKNCKILIVDDVVTNREILEKILESEGYEIIQVPSGELAVKIAPQTKPDLILLDVMMPNGIDGFETCRRLKANPKTRDIPVIFVSARNEISDVVDGFKFGGVDYISKPFHEKEIFSRIRTHILLKQHREQLERINKKLDQKVKDRTKELHETQLEIVLRLGRAAEYRDNETGNHIVRMSQYSKILAQAAGICDIEVELIQHASPMHDIGKIGIPDSVLLKPGRLNKDEWEEMKRHVEIGTKLLGSHNSDLMKMANIIALTHHEKWDGSGYPQGLKGEEIPLVGRICALCDAFDALTSIRVYKKSWSIHNAMEEIKKNSGIHFDPGLVNLFMNILPKILETKEKYSDK